MLPISPDPGQLEGAAGVISFLLWWQVSIGAGAGAGKLRRQLLRCPKTSPPAVPLAPLEGKPGRNSPRAAS